MRENFFYGEQYSNKIIKTLRLRISDQPGMLGAIASQIGRNNVLIGEIQRVGLDSHYVVRDITIFYENEDELEHLTTELKKTRGVTILDIRDEVLEIHRHGKIAAQATVKIESIADLQMVYTPGVASVCKMIEKEPHTVWDLTSIGNSVAIVTNGTAVLGLGDIGVEAGMPVMEGKAVLLNQLGGVSAYPILVDSHQPDDIVRVVKLIAKGFKAIQLEDIAAPACFEVEERLQRELDIPVFHDDQHGTAIVVLAGLMNALKKVRKTRKGLSVVINGAGAAGTAIANLLAQWGVGNIIICDRKGAIYRGRREHMTDVKKALARNTNPSNEKGTLADVMKDKDVFIGISGPNLVSKEMVSSMARNAIVFALANPRPEIPSQDALQAGAAIAMDGRFMNNALAFPGIFRGALDAQAHSITSKMKLAAARVIAASARKRNLLPHVLDLKLHKKVAKEVAAAWREEADQTS